jgi:hypothetical protein
MIELFFLMALEKGPYWVREVVPSQRPILDYEFKCEFLSNKIGLKSVYGKSEKIDSLHAKIIFQFNGSENVFEAQGISESPNGAWMTPQIINSDPTNRGYYFHFDFPVLRTNPGSGFLSVGSKPYSAVYSNQYHLATGSCQRVEQKKVKSK